MTETGNNHDHNQADYCTTGEAAEILGVTLRTVQLMVEKGDLKAWKTAGGHRRILRRSVERLLDKAGEETRVRGRTTPTPPMMERLKVLVVEDDNVLLKIYKAVLTSWALPIDVLTAANGVEGLLQIGRESPDLTITDLAMPGMDGFYFIRNLMASSIREGMTIVVVTGLDSDEVESRGGLPENIRVFTKPVPFPALREIVESLLQRRQQYLQELSPTPAG